MATLLSAVFSSGYAQKKKQAPAANPPAFSTEGMQKAEGFLTFYWDEKKGKVWLEIGRFDTPLLYYTSLASGMGSNDLGLDRGRLGGEHVVEFRRVGPKVLMVEPNQNYRALSENAAERLAVQEAFAESVLWGFDVTSEQGGTVMVDATPFLMRDALHIPDDIGEMKQGKYQFDATRSALYLPRSKAFPKNTEFEVTVTFTGSQAGAYVRSVVPSSEAFTVREHHSFVELPDDGYQPRPFDPRAGVNSISFYDYATPIDQPLEKRYITRHRLEKKDPSAAVSEPVEPIVYYLDPGTPEPIRSALMEGTAWWNQAFEAAGFRNAFRVELLPADADPMDVRYNVIQWVHRSTRGWSYGMSIVDPRTGEIIKGKVTLGSLRVRQDFLIAQGLVADYQAGKPVSAEMLQLSLARLRQLAAHEVGHTLGLPHNFIASTESRASVMDYPHPVVKINNNGTLDLSDAYATGIGDWDKAAIRYAYAQFPEGTDEADALAQLIQDNQKNGLHFLTDQDARPLGSAHPAVHLWDNGASAVEELQHVLRVREIALKQFGAQKIPVGTPLATLEEVLVPLYLFHRYQAEAAAKVVGGMRYTYALRGDGQEPLAFVAGDVQRKALAELLKTLSPSVLALPPSVQKLIPPRPFGYRANYREVFEGSTGLTFDQLAPAAAAADLTLSLLLHPERAARLEAHHAVEASLPDFTEVVTALLDATWRSGKATGYAGAVQEVVNQQVLDRLLKLATNATATAGVRAIAGYELSRLKTDLKNGHIRAGNALSYYALAQIEQFERYPQALELPSPARIPDGSPIGSDACGN